MPKSVSSAARRGARPSCRRRGRLPRAAPGRRERAVDRAHSVRHPGPGRDIPDQPGSPAAMSNAALPGIDLLRPLAEYEQLREGGW